MSDPLPQALVLTAIVITFGISAFVLAVIHRSWSLVRQEVVAVDEEDRRIAARKPRQADALDPDDLDPDDLDPDDLDPDDLDPEDRAVAGAARHGTDVEEQLRRRFPDSASDDVGLPSTRRKRR